MNAPDVFEECYQTSPNRLQPDWCWIARGAHALALGEPRFGPPAILDGIEIMLDFLRGLHGLPRIRGSGEKSH